MLNKRGIDVIILDHHEAGPQGRPDAVAVVNAKIEENSPYTYLCSAGVVFKLAHALLKVRKLKTFDLKLYLDLVAVATVADIVPLVDENRILVRHGLGRLAHSRHTGLKTLTEIAGIRPSDAASHAGFLNAAHVGFRIGPRINAAGRMRMDENDENAAPSGGYAAVNLLVENNESDAEDYGSIIDAFNQDRKSIDRHVTQEAHEIIESDPELKNRKSTVIYNPRWMKGIVGIVASRLIETYFRPTVVLTQSNGFATGSARSVPGFDLYQAVESCADLLENFGGHMYAAGLTMRPENVGEFTRRFNAYVEENIDPQMLVPQVDVDAELLFSEITPAFRRELKRFEPFGPGNAAPIFATRSVSNRGDAKLVGAECEHLRMDLTQRQKPNTTLQCIAFQQPEHFEWIRSGRPVDVCYQIVENHYRGTVSTQLRIKDIKRVEK